MKHTDDIMVMAHTSIKETMRVIDKGGIKIALVVDGTQRLLGVATDGDIRRGILAGVGLDEPVTSVMNAHPITASSTARRERIIDLLKEQKLAGLPLIDKDGIVKDFVMLEEGTETASFNKRPQMRRHLKRILVIGGAGFIGSVVVRKLLAKGYEVTVLDKFLYGRESLAGIATEPHLMIMEGDTRHIEDLSAAMRDVDAVVHLAELVGDPACALNPATTLEINYLATRTIATLCKHFQINRLVYASSCSVYGASQEDQLLTEESSLNPVSLYAKMKISSEEALIEIKDDNFRPTIMRLATVFGFSYRPRFDLVVNTLTAKAIQEGKISIFGGNQWRPNVHVGDVADTVVAILEAPIEKVGGQVFNVGSVENNHTIEEIGRMVNEEVPSAQIVIENKVVDRRDYRVDCAKLERVLGVKMKLGVRDGIREVKAALEEHKEIDYRTSKYSNIKFLEEQQAKDGNGA